MSDVDEYLNSDEHPEPKIEESVVEKDDTDSEESNNDGNNMSLTSTNLNLEAFANSEAFLDPDNIKAYSDMKGKDLSIVNEESESSDSRSSNEESSREDDGIESMLKNENTESKSHHNKAETFLHGSSSPTHHMPHNSSHNSSYGNTEGITDDHGKLLTEEELEDIKLDMLRKLGELAHYHDVELSENYSMNHPYKKMKQEYELHSGIRSKKNSIMFMRSSLLNIVFGLELFTSSELNPFSVDLNGWSKIINSEINNYYDVFGEIYEKYHQPGKETDPVLKLVMMVGASALQYSMSKTMMGMLPGINDGLKNDPAKQAKLRQLAINQRVESSKKEQTALNEYTINQHKSANEKIQNRNTLYRQKMGHNINVNRQDTSIDNVENMLNASTSTIEKPINDNKIKLPPALQKRMQKRNDPMLKRNIQESLLRRQMINKNNGMHVNPNMTPEQQEMFRRQQVGRQQLAMLQKEQLRQDILAKKQQEEAIEKIEAVFDQQTAEERSQGTISVDLKNTINTFYKKKNNNDNTSTTSSNSSKNRTR